MGYRSDVVLAVAVPNEFADCDGEYLEGGDDA